MKSRATRALEGDYDHGIPCPNCGSIQTTIYPLDAEGAYTLYCDACKVEESWEDTNEGMS